MNAKQSNLSAPNYGYDMVVATTQKAINVTMKEFLDTFASKEINICYQYDDNGALVQTDYNTLVKQAGVDPFSISSGVYHKTDPVAKLDDAGFAFAFKAKMGLPAMPPRSIPDIIVLNKGNAFVTYQLFCQEFSILNLEESGGGRNLTWTRLEQPADNPWVFNMSVNLDLRKENSSDAFSKLPGNVQDKIKNLNPDSAFSIQQLYLDLNTAGLESAPAIVGLDKSSNAYTYLTKIFLDTYFTNLSSSGVVLGYTVQPQIYNPSPADPSIIPTDMNIEVSPNLDANGDPTPNFGLYTLNYLVMSKNDKMPAPVQFTWNWVEDNEQLDFHGAMSIKRKTFLDYLNARLAVKISGLCLKPQVKVIYQDGDTYYHSPVVVDTNPHSYTINPTGSKVMSFSYHSDSADQAGAGGFWGSLSVTYDLTSDVTCSAQQIAINTTATFYMDIAALGGHAKGNALKYQANLTYDLSADASGNMMVVARPPDIKDLSDQPSSDTWASIINFLVGGQFQKIIDGLKNTLHSESFMIDDFDNYVSAVMQNNNFWVFPGGKTFAFKDVFFSDNQDLVSHITYAL